MDLPKTRNTLAVGVAAAAAVTAALAFVVWPALVRPEPPLEKTGDDGLRIRLVEPPKAAAKAVSPLDVGLSRAALAMVGGREALSARPAMPAPPSRPRAAPTRIAQAEDEAEASQPADDRWEDEAWRRDQREDVRRRRWEEERLAREARNEREAWEQEARERRRWREEREPDRYGDRNTPPPERW